MLASLAVAFNFAPVKPLSIQLIGLLASATLGVAATTTHTPRDWRCSIASAEFRTNAPGEWTSPLIQPPFAFDELIYSWQCARRGDSFRLYLQASFGPGDETDWLPAGYWGDRKSVV